MTQEPGFQDDTKSLEKFSNGVEIIAHRVGTITFNLEQLEDDSLTGLVTFGTDKIRIPNLSGRDIDPPFTKHRLELPNITLDQMNELATYTERLVMEKDKSFVKAFDIESGIRNYIDQNLNIVPRLSSEYISTFRPEWWRNISIENAEKLEGVLGEDLDVIIKFMRENGIGEHLMDESISIILEDLKIGISIDKVKELSKKNEEA